MQLVSIETQTAKKLFWSAAAGLGFLLIATAGQGNPFLLSGGLLIVVVGLWPLYIWLIGSSHGLPIWPGFSAYSASIAAMPVIQGARSLALYSDEDVFRGLIVTGAFLIVGSTVWLAMTARVPEPPKNVFMLEPGTAVRSLFWCVGLGVLFQINILTGWIEFPGNTMQIVRGVVGGLSYLGVFALAYFVGGGLLSRPQVTSFVLLVLALMLLSLTSLMLASIIPFMALLIIGLTLGAGRVPWVMLGTMFVLVAILHAGKYKMRETYDNAQGGKAIASVGVGGLPGVYAEWFSYGMQALGSFGTAFRAVGDEESESSVFERAGNLHMLLLVLDKTPREVPYLNGLTYEPIPYLLIPRFLAPGKSVSHVGNIMLSINYGLQDEEGAKRTSIGWSLIAEAYANFGYLGVLGLAVALASLYSGVTRISSGVPITSFRFISGLIVLAGVMNENSLGVFITMQFQGVVGVALAAAVMMRSHPNPMALRAAVVPTGTSPSRVLPAGTPASHFHSSAHHGAKAGGPSAKAPWMPRRMRRFVAAQREREATSGGLGAEETAATGPEGDDRKAKRPRQVAVPIQPYYYRSRKA